MQSFLAGQTERYGRYMKALEVLRAAHRDDPEVQKALAQFKRRARRPSSPSTQAQSTSTSTDNAPA